MRVKQRTWRFWALLAAGLVAAVLVFLATSNSVHIWPARNVLYYRVGTWWENQFGATQPAGEATLRGCVTDEAGELLTTAYMLVAERDGTTHSELTGSDGCYELTGVPAGRYVPMAGAPGHDSVAVRAWGMPLHLAAGEQRTLDITLPPRALPTVTPGRDLQLSAPITATSSIPHPSTAVRREITFRSGGEPNQPAFLYTPTDSDGASFPTLLAIYPGPAASWESVSVPLAAAGYAVIAVGPAYSLDLEADIDELQRLMMFVRAGLLPGADAQRTAVLAGSYSSLHALRLVQRDASMHGIVLLGPPTDLFDLRRRFEEGSFFPPFGLDQVLIALGRPHTGPENYWHYSARYHVRPNLPPLALMHSRSDEVVPFQQSELLAAEFDRVGLPYTTYFFDGLPHYLLADEASDQLDELYQFTLAFLEDVLPPTLEADDLPPAPPETP